MGSDERVDEGMERVVSFAFGMHVVMIFLAPTVSCSSISMQVKWSMIHSTSSGSFHGRILIWGFLLIILGIRIE